MMTGDPGRISLFITLGIAAIDMLTCAFVSAIVLFFLFLVPKDSAGASESEDFLLLHWSAMGATGAIIGINIERNGEKSRIWSDDATSIEDVCVNLSKASSTQGSCFLMNSGNDSPDQDGVLIISKPRAGQWSIEVTYGDTSDNGNKGNYNSLNLQLTLIRDEAIELSAPVAAGKEVNLATTDLAKAADVKKILNIE